MWKVFGVLGELVAHRTPIESLHVSLSRPFALRRPQIDAFVAQLKSSIAGHQFPVSFGRWDVLINDDRTRSFVALRIEQGRELVRSLISIVDSVLESFNLPIYHEVLSE